MSCFMKGAFIMMVMLAITLGLCYYANGFQIVALEQRFIGLNPIILHLILIGIISNLFVCITEELLFRGFIITYLNQFSISYWKVIFIAAFIFSAGHIYSDPIHYIIAFLGGVTLGFAYYKTQSLYYCMGIHFMYNLYNYLFTSAINEKPNTLIRPFIIKYEASILSVDKIDLFICMTFIGLFLYLWYKLGHREGLDRFAD
ncbi:CPBP family intramembrane glutamic endopeptidase [Arachidicoccus ginsenosidivorans]